MRFRDFLLSDNDMELMEGLIKEIRKNSIAFETFKSELARFFEQNLGENEYSDPTFKRICAGDVKSKKYSLAVVLFDFLNDHFLPKIIDQEELYTNDFDAIISCMMT